MKKHQLEGWSESRDERTYIRNWLKGVIEGLNSLDDATATKLLKKCGEMCARSWMKQTGLDKKYDLETFISMINKMQEKRRKKSSVWKKEGNTVYEEIIVGKCVCPLVTWGIIEPNSKLCLACCSSWHDTLFRDATGMSGRFELLDSIALGGKKCIFRHRIITKIGSKKMRNKS